MSGANAAPSRLTPINVTQAFGQDDQGKPVYPSMEFAQMIQRLLSFIGQPASSGGTIIGGNNFTISEQISNITDQTAALGQAPGSEAAGLTARVALLEAELTRKAWWPGSTYPAPPAREPPFQAPPKRAPMVWMPSSPALPPVSSVSASWMPAQNPNNLVIFTAPRAMFVTGIVGRLEIAQGAAATLSVVKAASGTALSAGTVVHTGTFNANGTPATNQILTMVASVATKALAKGDTIGIRTTGAWTISTGGITVAFSG